MEHRVWTVETIRNRETGLLIALSPDLPGLYVHGRSEEEVEERIPVAITALLEAAGEKVNAVVKCERDDLPRSFDSKVTRYAAESCYA